MSELRADTITASDGSSPATLTKQEAIKHYVNYDPRNETTDSSLNQSSVSDYQTGDFGSSFINNFSSGTDKVHHVSVINSIDDNASRGNGATRGGAIANLGHIVNDTNLVSLTSTSIIQFYSASPASGSSNGAETDYSATYCSSIGDLA